MQNTRLKNDRKSQTERALQLFDSLPNCARVALPIVCLITGRSPASVWRDVANDRLPRPIKAGPRSTRWIVGQLRAALFANLTDKDIEL